MNVFTIEDAIAFASNAHKGQLDKCGEPYILHPIRVMLSLNNKIERIVALLHDVIEDTDVTKTIIKFEFGKVVADAVDAMSKREGETYEDYLKRCASNPIALNVKRADISDNISPLRLYKMIPAKRIYLREKYSKALNYFDSLEK